MNTEVTWWERRELRLKLLDLDPLERAKYEAMLDALEESVLKAVERDSLAERVETLGDEYIATMDDMASELSALFDEVDFETLDDWRSWMRSTKERVEALLESKKTIASNEVKTSRETGPTPHQKRLAKIQGRKLT